LTAKPENREIVSAALRLLAGRDMSRTQFVTKLSTKEFSPEEIEAVAEWCQAEGYLNEVRYAENASRRLGAKYGANRVAQTLRHKGVNDEDVAASIATLSDSEVARAQVIWTRKFRELPVSATDRAKQSRFLQTRGFSYGTIKQMFKVLSEGN
jgi:regulatory protein